MPKPPLAPPPRIPQHITLPWILRRFWLRIAVTWVLVLLENLMIALIPLLIGWSIDGLLAGQSQELMALAGVLVALGLIAVARRIYDTRAYGLIRVRVGTALMQSQRRIAISKQSARLDMVRELVDFLETDVPELITAAIQITVSFAVLAYFNHMLGLSAALVVLGMLLVYGCFHRRFFRVNAALNAQKELQVEILHTGKPRGIFRHQRALRTQEVALSDTEAVVYGGIFLLQIAFIIFNLNLGAQLPDITAGKIFSIATYSWEYVEAALALPMALQIWSRLSEITQRINTPA
ncbi:ABC transporter six-transmembrane domain-containing protein [Phaeobacter sp.]|uniref:ABC transporter six-transmembrane domain-containing protein n=1 Tax=Phaeobacter sp. TaxID=1902409 RepID=UPI0025FA9E5B|nr:ABC transporter six-transmembrane domain-containing protein [Phaeobacter sp.]